MAKTKVYFTSMRAVPGDNLPQKLKRLVKTAGIGNIDFKNKFAAIKIHFGEPGNLAFLRPNYAAAVAETIKELGGKPFLTDCNTMYPGFRNRSKEDTSMERFPQTETEKFFKSFGRRRKSRRSRRRRRSFLKDYLKKNRAANSTALFCCKNFLSADYKFNVNIRRTIQRSRFYRRFCNHHIRTSEHRHFIVTLRRRNRT